MEMKIMWLLLALGVCTTVESKDIVEIPHDVAEIVEIDSASYAVARHAAPPQRPIAVSISDFDEVKKRLAKRVEFGKDGEVLRIRFRDGSVKYNEEEVDGEMELRFLGVWDENSSYYPDLDVLVLCSEDYSDRTIDLSDSSANLWYVGNPLYHAVSPDGRWRVSGWWNNGAGANDYFLERWNGTKYILVGDLMWDASGWFWSDNRTAMTMGMYDNKYYKLTIKSAP